MTFPDISWGAMLPRATPADASPPDVELKGLVEDDLDLNVSFLQEGRVVENGKVSMVGGMEDFSFGAWATVPRSDGDVTVRIDDEPAAAEPLSILLRPRECESFEMSVTLYAREGEPLRFGEPSCQ